MLRNGHLQQLSHHHWCAYIDGSSVGIVYPVFASHFQSCAECWKLRSTLSLLPDCKSVTLKTLPPQCTSDLSEPLVPLLPRPHSLSSLHPSEEGEELHGLRQPIPRHHSYLFHEKSRDSINGGSDSNVQLSSSSCSSSSSSSSSTRGNSRRNQVSLDNNLKHSDGEQPLKTQARKGRRNKISSSDESFSDHPTGTAESVLESGRRALSTSHDRPTQPQTRSARKPIPPSLPLTDTDTDTSTKKARKSRSSKVDTVSADSKKRVQSLKDDEETPLLRREKRVRSAPSKLSE